MSYFSDLIKAFFVPSEFYKEKANNLSFKSSLKHLLLTSIISTLIYFLFFLISYNFFYALQHKIFFMLGTGNMLLKLIPFSTKFITALFEAFFLIIVLLILIHVLVIIYHILLLILGSKQGFGKTYAAVIYGISPVLFFAIIPSINILFWLWSWYSQIVGIKKLHNTSGLKASISFILPFIIPIFLLLFIFFAQTTSVFNNSELACNTKQDMSNQKSCYLNLALKNNDKSSCENIENDGYRELCLSEFAVMKNDLDLCKSLPESDIAKNDCLSGLAKYRGDISLCEEINSKENSVDLKIYCKMDVAAKNNDLSICNSIQPTSFSNICIRLVAVTSFNKELCNQITQENLKNKCISDISWNSNNLESCKKKELGSKDADICWKNLAWKVGKIDFCQKIGNQESKQDCIREQLVLI